ncbi:MAG: carboxypeptidase-like regulatory domain-containing protein, partial [Massilibacteroides sp.]|nr:carboxypeptidase-like regulatory domain-containing protein [Massilibacteroides sp.]
MKIKKLGFILMLVTMMSQVSFAQNYIKGRVTDQTTKKALSFTNIYLPEQNKGTLTDENGEYELSNLPKGQFKIQFSYVGYKTIIKTILINQSKNVLNIALEPTLFQTEEV